VWLREIAQASERLEALIFGPGDFAASMHMPSSGVGAFDREDDEYPGHRWHAVMHAVVANARANALRCIDGPYGAHTEPAGFEKSCRVARSLGFDGKQCIHPSQLATANAIFSPTPEEIARARRVLDAYKVATAAGRGAVSLEGQMIDAANVRLAQVVIEQERRSNSTN
jgi:citrate lyase beta subunit